MFSASALLISATTLLFSASALLFSGFALLISAMVLLFSASALLYCTVLYLRVSTISCTCYSFLLVHVGKHLYEKYMNKDQYAYENKNL